MRVSFRLAILTLVLMLLGVSSGILIAFMFSKERDSVNHLKGIYLRDLADATARETGRLPHIAGDLLRECGRLSAAGLLPLDRPDVLARTLAERLRIHPSLKWVSYASDDGRFLGATRAGTNIVLNFSHPDENDGIPREFVLEPSGGLRPYLREPALTGAYDPRTREWYRRAVQEPGHIVWLPPYLFAEGVLGVTGALADSPKEGQPARGVFTADFSLEGISEYLDTLKVAEHGFAVLVDEGGRLLAAPSSDRLSRSGRALVELVASPTNRVFLINSNSAVTIGNQRYDILTRPVSPGTGLNWIALIFVPSKDFLGYVEANQRATLVVLSIGVVFTLLLGAYLSSAISRPLGSVTRELGRVARFEFDDNVPGPSKIKEIDLVQSALNAMKASLRSFSRFAPEDIVRHIALTGQEASLSGERREVTLLFCDLRGFTRLSEKAGPEQIVALLNSHFDAMVAVVTRYNGYVCDFLGDSLFVVFGAPAVSESHARDAVACGLEMQLTRHRLDAENRRSGRPEMEMGVGINTGPCVVGNMGSLRRIKYGVVGPAVNLASRIETFTVGGQVLVSDTTRQRLGDALIAEGPFCVEGKGVGSKITIWDIQGLADRPELRIPPAGGKLTQLPQPLRAALRRYAGKTLEPDSIEVVVSQLSERGARLSCSVKLDPFSSVQITLHLPPGDPVTFDAKVRAREGADFLVAFTGVQPGTRARLAGIIGQKTLISRSGAGGSGGCGD
jgi:class 3 adenylate cyclase